MGIRSAQSNLHRCCGCGRRTVGPNKVGQKSFSSKLTLTRPLRGIEIGSCSMPFFRARTTFLATSVTLLLMLTPSKNIGVTIATAPTAAFDAAFDIPFGSRSPRGLNRRRLWLGRITCSSLFAHPSGTPPQPPASAVLGKHVVSLPKPMGLVIEEVDDDNDDSCGVTIASIDPDGASAAFCMESTVARADMDVPCVRDRVLAVNGVDCSSQTFEFVMDVIVSAPTDKLVELTLGRPSDAVVVRWPNGVSVAARPGEPLGETADLAMYGGRIPFGCRDGGCGTCEQSAVIVKRRSAEGGMDGKGEQRYIRPCVARVPKGVATITILSPS